MSESGSSDPLVLSMEAAWADRMARLLHRHMPPAGDGGMTMADAQQAGVRVGWLQAANRLTEHAATLRELVNRLHQRHHQWHPRNGREL